jgi:hypothetical protein
MMRRWVCLNKRTGEYVTGVWRETDDIQRARVWFNPNSSIMDQKRYEFVEVEIKVKE